VEENNEGLIYKTYPREHRFTDQSPQAFNLKKFYNYASQLDDLKKASVTDLAEILFINGERVYPVIGEKENIKLTTPFDMMLAKLRIEQPDIETLGKQSDCNKQNTEVKRQSFFERLLGGFGYSDRGKRTNRG
jgi:hypothetical protein